MKFSDRIEFLRSESGMSKKQLGSEMGISDRMIYYYESGEKKPDIDMLIKLADFFDVSLDYLTGRSDDPRRDSAGRGGVAGDDYDE